MMTDDNLLRWLETRFSALGTEIQRIMDQLLKLEHQHEKCRDHCDSTTSVVFERLGDLNTRGLATDAVTEIQEKLMDRQVQQHQGFWIKAGALVMGATIISSIFSALLAHHWSK
jgi:hypothetical protein